MAEDGKMTEGKMMYPPILQALERPAVALFATSLTVGTSLPGGVFRKIDPVISGITMLAACVTAVCIAILHLIKVWTASRRLMRRRRRARHRRPP
jgi:hypothetical protein